MIGMTGTPSIHSVRARSFGVAAADYDKYRPRYPYQLVDDVVAMLPGRRVLEVGAGTGIATAAFAARGISINFTNLRTHRYHWTRRMSVADYVARVNTTSAHLILPSEVRDDMTVELIATLAGYGDEIELVMTTDLAMAVRR
jgi:predicted nicotinamide N-methyase